MKRTLICLLVAFSALGSAAAAAPPSATEITASGSGSIALAPDMATVNASVETNAAQAQDAIADNNARYDRVVAALVKIGIARADISLSYYNVNYNPPPKVVPATSEERYGYTVSRSFSIKVRAIASAGRVSDACIAAGATAVNGVSFGLADPSAAREQAIAKAVTAARSSAEALARAAALRIVSMKSIELTSGEYGGPQPLMMAKVAGPTQFDQSNVNVSVSVSIIFFAEPY
ncbi:MAG: SIMPL domain-containing protein [Candidatus Eremiobacteraeota bacterium]|nr:SIMPL domain-containing protein [Candidatus Eremiobacteraeota bacterium]